MFKFSYFGKNCSYGIQHISALSDLALDNKCDIIEYLLTPIEILQYQQHAWFLQLFRRRAFSYHLSTSSRSASVSRRGANGLFMNITIYYQHILCLQVFYNRLVMTSLVIRTGPNDHDMSMMVHRSIISAIFGAPVQDIIYNEYEIIQQYKGSLLHEYLGVDNFIERFKNGEPMSDIITAGHFSKSRGELKRNDSHMYGRSQKNIYIVEIILGYTHQRGHWNVFLQLVSKLTTHYYLGDDPRSWQILFSMLVGYHNQTSRIAYADEGDNTHYLEYAPGRLVKLYGPAFVIMTYEKVRWAMNNIFQCENEYVSGASILEDWWAHELNICD